MEGDDASTDADSGGRAGDAGSIASGAGGRCGDGKVSGNERCDTAIGRAGVGACPTECALGTDPCRPERLRGDDCDARCEAAPITARVSGDKCCPRGATVSEDSDCGPGCGNGALDANETCDPPSSCPLCPVSTACLRVEGVGDANACTFQCKTTEITECRSDDACCPGGCNTHNDNDCSASCGNGVIDPGETCEKSSEPLCPAACDDMNPCTIDMRTGSDDNCNVACTHVAITMPLAGDTCCPAGATSLTDADCPAACGNGVIEGDEDCDDGNTNSGDGCDLHCALESGPLACTMLRGDNLLCAACLCERCQAGCFIRNSARETMECNAIAACIRETGCSNLQCYCGENLVDCVSGTANGPCKDVIDANASSTNVVQIVAELGNEDRAAGRALRVATCERSQCVRECGR